MPEPRASRPYMPGYGVLGAGEGRGLLPWSWAEERLGASHRYWVVSVGRDGQPHAMPVWGVAGRMPVVQHGEAVAQGLQPARGPSLCRPHRARGATSGRRGRRRGGGRA